MLGPIFCDFEKDYCNWQLYPKDWTKKYAWFRNSSNGLEGMAITGPPNDIFDDRNGIFVIASDMAGSEEGQTPGQGFSTYFGQAKQGGVSFFLSHLGEIVIKILVRLFRQNLIFLLRLFRQIKTFLFRFFRQKPSI